MEVIFRKEKGDFYPLNSRLQTTCLYYESTCQHILSYLAQKQFFSQLWAYVIQITKCLRTQKFAETFVFLCTPQQEL